MRYALKTGGQGDGEAPERRTVAHFVAVIAAAEVAFLFGLVTNLSWQGCVLAVLVATALAGGAVLTVLEMQRLESEGRRLYSVRDRFIESSVVLDINSIVFAPFDRVLSRDGGSPRATVERNPEQTSGMV